LVKCDTCKHFEGWQTAAYGWCELGEIVSGFEAETCEDYEYDEESE